MGTQTSKPLHGDEERRLRFRSPRTPMNSDGSTSNLTTTSASDTVTSSETYTSSTRSSQRARTWPCSNCHATVSNEESRCPYCGGIQVTIPRSPPSTAKAMMNSELLLQRFKAASPTTPVGLPRKEIVNPSKQQLLAFMNRSEGQNTSAMNLDDTEEAESLNHNDTNGNLMNESSDDPYNHLDRPNSALSQSSSISQSFNLPLTPPPQQLSSKSSPSSPSDLPFVTPQGLQFSRQQETTAGPHDSSMLEESGTSTETIDNNSSSLERPPDPVALTLEAAQLRSGTPSPSPSQHQNIINNNNTGAAAKRKATTKPSGGGFEVPKKKMVLP